jgi:IS30 family transposase
VTAHDLACRRRRRRRKLIADDTLREHVVERLEAGWSPQQIAGRLKQEAPDRASVCHETIYRHVYGPEGRRDNLYRHLPKARRRRGSHYGRKPRSAAIPRERWIENRPAEVGDRQVFGHWECDLLILSRGHGKANVTSLVERKSRFGSVALADCGRAPTRSPSLRPEDRRAGVQRSAGSACRSWAHHAPVPWRASPWSRRRPASAEQSRSFGSRASAPSGA